MGRVGECLLIRYALGSMTPSSLSSPGVFKMWINKFCIFFVYI